MREGVREGLGKGVRKEEREGRREGERKGGKEGGREGGKAIQVQGIIISHSSLPLFLSFFSSSSSSSSSPCLLCDEVDVTHDNVQYSIFIKQHLSCHHG